MLSLYLRTDNGVEVLLAPAKNRVKIFERYPDVSRWVEVNKITKPEEAISNLPLAIEMTERDEQNIELYNLVTQLADKSRKAWAKRANTNATTNTLDELVTDYIKKLEQGDRSLAYLLSDPRLTQEYLGNVDIRPIVESQDYQPVVTQTIQQAKPVKVMNIPITNQASYPMATIPDRKWADEYISRVVVGNLTEFDIYDVAMKNHQNVLLEGHAGSGKTISVLAYASKRGYKYYNVSSHIGLEPSQLFGKWIPTPEGNFVWQDGAVTELCRNGGVLLLNEINFMPERVTTILFGLLDSRREIQLMDNNGEVIKAHKDLLIVADMNPNYRGTRPMNQAWKDRFHHVLEFPYSQKIENKIVNNKSLLSLATKLRTEFDNETIETPISTRKLVGFVSNVENLGLDYAIYTFLNSFNENERQAVKIVIDTYRANLEQDFGINVAKPDNQEVQL